MLLRCPYGCSPLDKELSCTKGHKFDIRDGIYYLHKNDEAWEEVKKEALGTIECLKEDKAYRKEDWVGQDKYPYFDVRSHVTDCNRVMFNTCKKLIGKPKESFLEIGAKSCWATNQLLKYGFKEGVASDITDDPLTALGFGKELIEGTGRFFERVVCDAAYLPFEENSFDLVFSCSTLHHIREKQKAIDACYRVLRPGGIFLSMGDNPRHLCRSMEEAMGPVKREREKFHINETQDTVAEYYSYFDNAGFTDYFFYPFDSNLLLENWDWENDEMVVEIIKRGLKFRQNENLLSQISLLGERTRKMINTLERFTMLNYWMFIPNNTVIWGIK